jgi:hypothetical protein
MAVYRPDPPVRLPLVGVAALLAIAASVPANALANRAAYLRDAPAIRASQPAVAAVFAPADPVFDILPAARITAAAYLRDYPASRIPQAYARPVAASMPGAVAISPAAYLRASAVPWTLAETWALYAPADPVYAFGGPVLQSVAAYRRDPTTAAPLPVFAQPQVAQAVPATPALPRAAYARTDPLPWTLQETWTLYAPADPAYAFAGPVLQSVSAYRRDPTPAPLLPVFAAPPAAQFIPAVSPLPRVAYLRTDPLPWSLQETWSLYAPADPVYQFAGVSRQSPSAYVRDVAVPALVQRRAIPTPAGNVPAAVLARADRRDAAAVTQARAQLAALITPASAFYVFRGMPPQSSVLYERDRGAGLLPRLLIVQPGVPVIAPVYGDPTYTRVVVGTSPRIGATSGDATPRIGSIVGGGPRRIGGGTT